MANNKAALARQEAKRIESINTLRRLRKEARDEISRLIRFLDESDDYAMTELEDDDSCLLEDGGDSEPSLGSFDRMVNQERSYRKIVGEFGAALDAEQDDSDLEPSLGSCDPPMWGGDQTHWAAGSRDDREREDDTGIGDMDGSLEQVGSQDWQDGAMG
jgi:hypothetical protein